ncbi:hypothetical protein Scep_013709 [Stephania cephalantha]|uniref:VQ domain-containing protein n=1 Tax=Stephania cephalantha TaxID=152367 RepID=A0AAP0J1R1_9MAGN
MVRRNKFKERYRINGVSPPVAELEGRQDGRSLPLGSGTLLAKATRMMKKKQPVKVVYISNPMMVKTSVSEFRALVQELTGQDSDLADYKFSDDHDHDDSTSTAAAAAGGGGGGNGGGGGGGGGGIATTTTTTSTTTQDDDDDDDDGKVVGDEFVEEIMAVDNYYDGYWQICQGFDNHEYNHYNYHHEEDQGLSSSHTMVENLNGFLHCNAVFPL